MAHDKTLGLAPTMISNLIERWDGFGDPSLLAGSGGGDPSPAGADIAPLTPPSQSFAAEDADADPEPEAPKARRALPVLSPRQYEILTRIAAGQTSPSIASDLGLSTRTIDHYVGAVCKKLGAKSRAQAVATALKMTLISPPQT